MDAFGYLAVLISIVVGLGLSHLLAGAARLVRHRSRVRLYGPSLAWTALLFLLHVQIWWAVFELRGREAWTFPGFALVLAVPVLAYLLAYLLVPETEGGGTVNLEAAYYRHRRWFFGVLALLPVTSLVQEWVLSGGIEMDADPVFRLAFLGLAALGFATRRKAVHVVVSAVALVGFAAYVLMLFFRLA